MTIWLAAVAGAGWAFAWTYYLAWRDTERWNSRLWERIATGKWPEGLE